jgi:hypothetical protein
MNHSQIIEGNLKIAIFMGAELLRTVEAEMPHGSHASVTLEHWKRPNGLPGFDSYADADMGHFRYDRDWDWIMPVLTKIADAGYEYTIGKSKNGQYCSIWRNDDEVVGLFAETTRMAIWQTVIDFIDLYNSDNLPTTDK